MAFSNDEFKKILNAINCLTVYRGIFGDPILRSFREALELTVEDDPTAVRKSFGMLGSLFENEKSFNLPAISLFKNHLLNIMLADENPFSLAAERKGAGISGFGKLLNSTVKNDLSLLKIIYDFDLSRLAKSLEDKYSLEGFALSPGSLESSLGLEDSNDHDGFEALNSSYASAEEEILRAGNIKLYPQYYFKSRDQIKKILALSADWRINTDDLKAYYRQTGSGCFGRYWAFRWNGRGPGSGLTGVANPDQISLEDLVGYENQKQQVLRNTEQFIRGFPANNLLLYGDRGTGKSSTIKSLIHRYGRQGLRIIEITKHDLHFLHQVTAAIAGRALKFIIFIDDLSFEEDETEYKELKALLEGSIEKPPENVLVYATSNRKNLVREYFRDREPDEVGRQETYQEKLSLADRFGIKLVYSVPDKEEYLATVEEIAAKSNIKMERSELHELALRWSLWHNARSGRTARQFIDDLKGRLGLEDC